MRRRPARLLVLSAAALLALVTAGCSSRIPLSVCRIAGRLAFQTSEPRSWFGRRGWLIQEVRVTQADGRGGDAGPQRVVWEARAQPVGNIERSILFYGQALPSWHTAVRPERLKRGRKYAVSIIAPDDLGWEEFTYGESLPDCPPIR